MQPYCFSKELFINIAVVFLKCTRKKIVVEVVYNGKYNKNVSPDGMQNCVLSQQTKRYNLRSSTWGDGCSVVGNFQFVANSDSLLTLGKPCK
jgi:hypothetical protein